MPNDRELMDVHARALFTHDARSRLVSVNEPWGEAPAAPRLFLGRTREGNVWRLRADLPEGLAGELEVLCADEPARGELGGAPPRHSTGYVRLLDSHAPTRRQSSGPAFHFTEYPEPSNSLLAVTEENAECLRGGFEELLEELPARLPFLAVVEGGRAVSVCRSVRATAAAHEAGVETLPDFRGRGYARDAVAGWARVVRSGGVEPLYSTSWDNTASRALAKSLRLRTYGSDFHLT